MFWQVLTTVIISLWLLQAVLSVLANRRHAKRLRDAKEGRLSDPPPHATVIMPIKGVDVDLPAAIKGLCEQDYADYDVVLVLESPADPAHDVLQRELAKYPQRHPRILFAGAAPPTQGQKVHNQLHALQVLDPAAKDDDIWAFADSDAIPGPRWLRDMVGRLGPHTAVTTGYRWMIPDPGKTSNVWSHLASVINSSVACHHRPSNRDQAWGGAMVMTVGTARRGELVHRWTGALTDDYPVTRMGRDLGLTVRYLPRCLAATPVDFSFRSLLSFGRRQYLITRVYAPFIYAAALVSLTLWLVGFVTAWTSFIVNIVAAPASHHWWYPAAALLLVHLSHHARMHYRIATIRRAFGQAMVDRLRPTLRFDRWLTPVWMALHWGIAASALCGRRFTWRGIRYQLDGPQEVRRLS